MRGGGDGFRTASLGPGPEQDELRARPEPGGGGDDRLDAVQRQIPPVEEDAAARRLGRARREELRLGPEVPHGGAVRADSEPAEVRRVGRSVDEHEVGGRERGPVERRERTRPESRRRDQPPVLDQRLAECHERREDQTGARPADASGEQRVELATEANDDERRRTRPRAPAPGEPARRGRIAHGEARERRWPEVRRRLVPLFLPDRLVTLDDVEARPGERRVEQAVGAVGADVRAEQARGHRWPRRTSSRCGDSPASRTTFGPSPNLSSSSRTR